MLPHLWYRNTWSWEPDGEREVIARGRRRGHADTPVSASAGGTARVGRPGSTAVPENETNYQRIDNAPNQTPYVKDGINNPSSTAQQAP